MQDSFEYINQDPNLGRLNTNQNNLGPCRTGSNLGNVATRMGSFLLNASVAGVRFALFELVVLFCVGFFFFALSLIRVYLFFFVCVCTLSALLCVCLSLGLLQACSSKLQGLAEGGPLRLTRSASFFAGLCGMLSAV